MRAMSEPDYVQACADLDDAEALYGRCAHHMDDGAHVVALAALATARFAKVTAAAAKANLIQVGKTS